MMESLKNVDLEMLPTYGYAGWREIFRRAVELGWKSRTGREIPSVLSESDYEMVKEASAWLLARS